MKCINNFSLCLLSFALIKIVLAEDCNNSESPLTCHSSRVIRNVMQHVIHDNSEGSLKLVPGLEIVPVDNYENEIDSNGGTARTDNDTSWVGRVARYLQTHELQIKFPELIERSEFKDVIRTALSSIDEGKGVVEGRKKGKGLGLIMLMGLMMGKMMGALGLGGVGLLAMKALGVSMMALMLAAIIGVKKLAEGGGGGGDGHHVQYVTAHGDHHRKRRTIDEYSPLPYQGWTQYQQQN